MIRPFVLALVFLTRIPVPVWFRPQPEEWGRSVFFFPWVGLVIGLMMASLYALFPYADPGVLAALLLTIWVLTTGGLHLDGLADAADAWAGGAGDRDRILAIMKDPRSGPMAVVVTVLVLLAKFATLQVVVEYGAWKVLLWVPVLGRAAILLMLITTPYVRPYGIGMDHAGYLPRIPCIGILLVIAVVTVLELRWDGTALLSALGIGFILLRQELLKRLGGTTGDTLGASCELIEAATLVILVLLIS